MPIGYGTIYARSPDHLLPPKWKKREKNLPLFLHSNRSASLTGFAISPV